nr:uncharacterized protein LOC106692696 [Halyomorpha halys]
MTKFSDGGSNYPASTTIFPRPGKLNKVVDTLSRVCGATSNNNLLDIHRSLCHPRVTRMYHCIKSKNLPFSLDDVKRMTTAYPVCAELKPRFYKPVNNHLIKATRPFERLNVDFKWPVPSSTRNHYLLTIVDEYSRFPFAYPCRDMTSATVKKHLYNLFTIFGTPAYIHSDRGTSFLSKDLADYLHTRGISTSSSTTALRTGPTRISPRYPFTLVHLDQMHSSRSNVYTRTPFD